MEESVNFDNEVLAYLSTRKDELMDQHEEYISEHPEIREVLNDFLSSVLLHKPVSLQNHLDSRSLIASCFLYLEWCLRVCQRVLPSIQPISP